MPRSSALYAACLFAFTLFANGVEVPGVSNFHKVNDRLYRGAQPSAAGFQNLAKMGVKTVIDLRTEGGREAEKKQVETAGMRYVSVPMKNFGAPTDDQIAKVMTVLEDDKAGPVFIHCRRGADRTGTMVACYRITKDQWANDKALAEAQSCGMSRFERAMQNFVRAYKAKTQAPAGTPTMQSATR